MQVTLEHGARVHINPDAIRMAWGGDGRYVLQFGSNDTIYVDKDSYDRVVKWMDSGWVMGEDDAVLKNYDPFTGSNVLLLSEDNERLRRERNAMAEELERVLSEMSDD